MPRQTTRDARPVSLPHRHTVEAVALQNRTEPHSPQKAASRTREAALHLGLKQSSLTAADDMYVPVACDVADNETRSPVRVAHDLERDAPPSSTQPSVAKPCCLGCIATLAWASCWPRQQANHHPSRPDREQPHETSQLGYPRRLSAALEVLHGPLVLLGLRPR